MLRKASMIWRAVLSAVALIFLQSNAAHSASGCLALSGLPYRSLVQPATFRLANLQRGEVQLTFVGHSTFLIESEKGIRIATDYNDYVRPSTIPDIATMNRAHDTHYTMFPDPTIRHVLRGWNPDGGAAQHDVTLEDVRVRNVPTNIRGWDGGTSQYGNSIFVFEVGDLCIAHLGHLHHTLRPDQITQIGQVDVLLVPVDGSYTLDLPGMLDVLAQIRAPLIIPMHYFSRSTLDRFLTQARDRFQVTEMDSPTLVLSRATLPARQEIRVLPGR